MSLTKSLISCLETMPCPVFTAWIGGDNVEKARQAFNKAGVVTYDSAERAVRAFKNLYQYGCNIETLLEIPVRTDKKLVINRFKAADIIKKAVSNRVESLTEIQAKNLLHAYGIPVNTTKIADTEEMAVQISKQIGYSVVLKICSKNILHKSDSNGVILNLKKASEVKEAFKKIMVGTEKFAPKAAIDGVSVQTMQAGADYELIIGAKTDPSFGPLILFGIGGS